MNRGQNTQGTSFLTEKILLSDALLTALVGFALTGLPWAPVRITLSQFLIFSNIREEYRNFLSIYSWRLFYFRWGWQCWIILDILFFCEQRKHWTTPAMKEQRDLQQQGGWGGQQHWWLRHEWKRQQQYIQQQHGWYQQQDAGIHFKQGCQQELDYQQQLGRQQQQVNSIRETTGSKYFGNIRFSRKGQWQQQEQHSRVRSPDAVTA